MDNRKRLTWRYWWVFPKAQFIGALTGMLMTFFSCFVLPLFNNSGGMGISYFTEKMLVGMLWPSSKLLPLFGGPATPFMAKNEEGFFVSLWFVALINSCIFAILTTMVWSLWRFRNRNREWRSKL